MPPSTLASSLSLSLSLSLELEQVEGWTFDGGLAAMSPVTFTTAITDRRYGSRPGRRLG